MAINPDKIAADIEAIARFTATPGAGADRPTFSPQWREARDYVIAQAKSAGCKSRIDAAGNVHIRHESLPWETLTWLSGSHLDSVPHGGDFDGDCTAPESDVLLPAAGARGCPAAPGTSCTSVFDAVDMSGNAAEWTSSAVGVGSFGFRCAEEVASYREDVERRAFVKFMVLVSAAFAPGQFWVVCKDILRRRLDLEHVERGARDLAGL